MTVVFWIAGGIYAPAVQAFELFGICLISSCGPTGKELDEAKIIDPHRYDLVFDVSEFKNDDLKDAVRNGSQLWNGRDSAVPGSAGLIARAKGDYRRILATLYEAGYYGGAISIKINRTEAADIGLGRQLPKKSNVIISVDPGNVYRFGRAEIEKRAPPTGDPEDHVEKADRNKFESGEIAKAGAIRKAGKIEVERWRQQGYPKARVADRNATAIHPDTVLNVLMRMQPGQLAYYGDTTVEGTNRMDPAFVAYMAGIPYGKEYDPDDLERAKKRLDRLGVFSSRKIVEAETINADQLLPLHVVVNEKKRRRIGLGASVSSVDGAGVEAYWLHRNLFGKAESIRFDAKFGGIGTTAEVDQFDYELGTTFRKPGVFSPDTDLVANVIAKREFNETFLETSARGSVFLEHYYSDNLTLKGGVFAEIGEFEDVFGTRQFFSTGFEGDVVYDARNSKLEPTSGFYLAANVQPFYEWEFGNPTVRLLGEARGYLTADDDGKNVFAARVKVGSVVGASLLETPPDVLFSAGGGNSVRGFSFKTIGIEAPNNQTVPGASLLETSVEYRRRINESFGAVAFVDAGVVGADEFVSFDEDVKVGVGLGVRYYTGLGPIRLDVAVPLNPGPDDGSFAIYAGIGQAF